MPQKEQEEPGRTERESLQAETGPSEREASQEGSGQTDVDRERSGLTDPPEFEDTRVSAEPHSEGVPPGEPTDRFGRRQPPEEENLG